MDEPRKQVKQASHTKKILYASIYMRYIEYSYSLRQKVEQWPGAYEKMNGELLLNGYSFSVG